MRPERTLRNQPIAARLYIGAVAALGSAALLAGYGEWSERGPGWVLLVYTAIAIVAAQLKVVLPGVKGALSLLFVFVLVGVTEFSYSETVTLAILGMLSQSLLFRRTRPDFTQTVFNVSAMTSSTAAAYAAAHELAGKADWVEMPLLVLTAAVVFFFCNTGSIAVVIALTERRSPLAVWRDGYFWSFPLYMLGAAVATVVHATNARFGWQTTLLVFPVLYAMYRSYHLHVSRIEEERTHAVEQQRHIEELNALHLRTIEALALAIEAKDHTTHDHLERVQVYALAIGRELGLDSEEIDALRAASLLHDIGKLAVPEHIISKPGRLTPEEFEKMKIHPVVGAEILEQVRFPYPVVPVVRSHHEKWDGSGYPDGLAGEEIPIGSRILSAVDCLDALATDRQYRRALPLEEAIEVVKAESGKAFDPRVVEVLSRRYVELERMAKTAGEQADKPKLSGGSESETRPRTGRGIRELEHGTGQAERIGGGGRGGRDAGADFHAGPDPGGTERARAGGWGGGSSRGPYGASVRADPFRCGGGLCPCERGPDAALHAR
ncbi:MAG: HD domain-containing protein [Bryobacteraceae bacterium]